MAKNNSKILPVYLVLGNDKLKVDNVLTRLDDVMNQFGDMSFNKNVYDAENIAAGDVVQSCILVPFMADKRFVVVKNAEKFKKDDCEILIDYIKNLNQSCVLVLQFASLSKASRLYKAVASVDKTAIISCDMPKKYKLADTVVQITHKYNASINVDAAKKLIDLIGEDTLHLDAEIQKLLLNSRERTITIDQVSNQVSKSSEVKPWDFTDAYAARDLNTCFNLYEQMGEGAEYVLLPNICKIVKELICVHDLGSKANQYSVADALSYSTWKTKNHVNWARNFKKYELIDILDYALDCEVKIKSSSNSKASFEDFLIKTLSK